MADSIQATRLGDILLEKGLIDREQLREAIAEQMRRRAEVDPNNSKAMDATSLGEILIHRGYINRQQLKRGLNWQLYLRKMTIVMSLCAPLMTWAGGAQAESPANQLQQPAQHHNTQAAAHKLKVSAPLEQLTYEAIPCIKVSGRVMLKWDVPRYREDGTYLDIADLGGYELRYRKLDEGHFTYVSINDPWKNYYQFRHLDGDYVVQVAAFDRQGHYSKFVPLAPEVS